MYGGDLRYDFGQYHNPKKSGLVWNVPLVSSSNGHY